jgi:hypothetical protein
MSDDEGLYIECACDATTTTLASPNRTDVSLIISYTPQNMQISFAAIEIGIWTYEKTMNENKMAEMLVRAHLVIQHGKSVPATYVGLQKCVSTLMTSSCEDRYSQRIATQFHPSRVYRATIERIVRRWSMT